MIACVVPLNESITTGAVNFDGSKLNFIGNVSFEGNHANASGGTGQFEDSVNQVLGTFDILSHVADRP